MRWRGERQSDNVEDRRGVPDRNHYDTFGAPAL